ncbi:MAG: hypothetical protein M1436_08915 [Acidobacteria bacterium]|nr:hypothetical protein [Acidobacteriota bacterium]
MRPARKRSQDGFSHSEIIRYLGDPTSRHVTEEALARAGDMKTLIEQSGPATLPRSAT